MTVPTTPSPADMANFEKAAHDMYEGLLAGGFSKDEAMDMTSRFFIAVMTNAIQK